MFKNNEHHPKDGENDHSQHHFTFHDLWNYQFKVGQAVYLFAGLLALQIVWNILVLIFKCFVNCWIKRKGRLYRQQRDEQLKSFVIPTPNLDQDTIQNVLNGDILALKKLLKNKVTSEDLVNIFAKRCQQFGSEYNIITHLKYEEAIRQAKECDQMRKNKASQCSGLLFGIPISIKETFEEKGKQPNLCNHQKTIIQYPRLQKYINYFNSLKTISTLFNLK